MSADSSEVYRFLLRLPSGDGQTGREPMARADRVIDQGNIDPRRPAMATGASASR
jgi:hypothetical protein